MINLIYKIQETLRIINKYKMRKYPLHDLKL